MSLDAISSLISEQKLDFQKQRDLEKLAVENKLKATSVFYMKIVNGMQDEIERAVTTAIARKETGTYIDLQQGFYNIIQAYGDKFAESLRLPDGTIVPSIFPKMVKDFAAIGIKIELYCNMAVDRTEWYDSYGLRISW